MIIMFLFIILGGKFVEMGSVSTIQVEIKQSSNKKTSKSKIVFGKNYFSLD